MSRCTGKLEQVLGDGQQFGTAQFDAQLRTELPSQRLLCTFAELDPTADGADEPVMAGDHGMFLGQHPAVPNHQSDSNVANAGTHPRT